MVAATLVCGLDHYCNSVNIILILYYMSDYYYKSIDLSNYT
jgi:hypothetical protein